MNPHYPDTPPPPPLRPELDEYDFNLPPSPEGTIAYSIVRSVALGELVPASPEDAVNVDYYYRAEPDTEDPELTVHMVTMAVPATGERIWLAVRTRDGEDTPYPASIAFWKPDGRQAGNLDKTKVLDLWLDGTTVKHLGYGEQFGQVSRETWEADAEMTRRSVVLGISSAHFAMR